MLLLLHGALGSASQLQPLSSQLSERSHASLDLPGHGGLPILAPFSMELFAEGVLHFLDQEDIPQADIFGYSMGGYVALWLAWKHPERVRSVVTLNTKLDWTPDVATRMSGMFDPEKIEAKVPAFAEALAQAHAPTDWKQVARYTAHFLHDLGNGLGLPTEAYAQITCPVTILRGEFDHTVSTEESQQTAAMIPNAVYKEIPGGKHAIEQVDTAAIVQTIEGGRSYEL